MVPAGAGDDLAGGGEEPVAPAFDVPAPCLVAVGQSSELEPGDQVRGQDREVRPGLVRGEIEERGPAQPDVLQRLDAVLAAAPGTVPGIQ